MKIGLVGAALLPHPPILFPEIGGSESAKVEETRRAVESVAKWLRSLDAEVLVLISPHGPALPDGISVMAGSGAIGDLGRFGMPRLRLRLTFQEDYVDCLAEAAVGCGVRVHLDPVYPHRVDHGVTVPLLALHRAGIDLPVVVLGYPALSDDAIADLGCALAVAASRVGRRTVVVASGDLSHRLTLGAPAGYDPEAANFDQALVRAFRRGTLGDLWSLPPEMIDRAGECGHRPLLTALAALDAVDPDPIPLLHSYEYPFGVGYAVATLTPRERAGALDPAGFARASLLWFLRERTPMPIPDSLAANLSQPAGCFVSLYESGELRGCIGTTDPTKPTLADEIVHNTVASASRDPRFPPVSMAAAGSIQVSVDVLGQPEPASAGDLDPKVYGVIVSKGPLRGVLLPDLPGIHSAEEQLEIAARKAGIHPGDPERRICRFEVKRYGTV